MLCESTYVIYLIKIVETESRTVACHGLRVGENEELLFNGYMLWVLQDEMYEDDQWQWIYVAL